MGASVRIVYWGPRADTAVTRVSGIESHSKAHKSVTASRDHTARLVVTHDTIKARFEVRPLF